MRRRLYPNDLRALASMMEHRVADGYIEVSQDFDDDFGFMEIGAGGRTKRGSHERVTVELQVEPNWEIWARAYDGPRPGVAPPPQQQQSRDEVRERYEEVMRTPPNRIPPVPRDWERQSGIPRDYRGALELFVSIVKNVVRAWAMDDNKIRFGLLELD